MEILNSSARYAEVEKTKCSYDQNIINHAITPANSGAISASGSALQTSWDKLKDTAGRVYDAASEGAGAYVVMICGPSKTADIEMNVVTGVHGPNVVKAFILQ